MTGEAADAVVVGAGVIGLTTGICLAEADSKCESELLSFQGTPRRPRRWQWSVLPSVDPGMLQLAWERTTIEEFHRLAEVPDTGVHVCRG